MKKRDIVIIAVFLVIALVGLGAVKIFAPTGNITYADIFINDKLYEAVPLNEDTVITIDQGDGKVNHIEVKDGAIFMADSSCADHLCITQGAMSPRDLPEPPHAQLDHLPAQPCKC